MWARSADNPERWIILDREGRHLGTGDQPERGEYVIDNQNRARVARATDHGSDIFMTHWATCPDADRWHNRGKNE